MLRSWGLTVPKHPFFHTVGGSNTWAELEVSQTDWLATVAMSKNFGNFGGSKLGISCCPCTHNHCTSRETTIVSLHNIQWHHAHCLSFLHPTHYIEPPLVEYSTPSISVDCRAKAMIVHALECYVRLAMQWTPQNNSERWIWVVELVSTRVAWGWWWWW